MAAERDSPLGLFFYGIALRHGWVSKLKSFCFLITDRRAKRREGGRAREEGEKREEREEGKKEKGEGEEREEGKKEKGEGEGLGERGEGEERKKKRSK